MTTTDPVALLQDLLRCPSITPAEGGALQLLDRVLSAAGFTVERPVFSEAGTPDIENLYARIGTDGPNLVFAGHTDVVPVGDESRWTHNPFAGEITDGVLYGRGAVDMKGGIACFIAAALDHLTENGGRTNGSISLLITGDEEGPSINGTVKLLQWADERGETFSHAIVGEPTNPEHLGDMIKIGRRGSFNGIVTVEGKQGHVAYPHRADNPVPKLVRLMAALSETPLDAGNDHFDASNLEVVALDAGAGAFNIIPARASGRFNVRFNDIWSQASLEAELRRRMDATGIAYTLDLPRGNSDSFLTAPGPFVEMVAQAIRAETGVTPKLSTTGGTSDARFIKDYCPVIEFGLVGQTMHMVDERVPVADLHALKAVYRRIIDAYFAG